MRSPHPKKHHYVPQFILKNFCLSKKNRLYVFDKSQTKIFPSHVRDIGHENNFYKEKTIKYDIDTESKLAELESTCAPIIRKIIENKSIFNLSTVEFRSLCLFTAVQLDRTNNSRETLTHINNEIADWIQESGLSPDQIEGYETLNEEDIKELSIHTLRTGSAEMAEHLISKELMLVEAPKGESFYISDNPVTLYNHFPREYRGNLGLAVEGIEIYYPISPNFCLSFICSATIAKTRKAVNDQKSRKLLGIEFPIDMSEPEMLMDAIDTKITRTLKSENVIFHNSLQVSQSSRFIYSSDKDFFLAMEMLKTNPEIAVPHPFQQ